MAYQVFMDGWDRGDDPGLMWVAYAGEAVIINPTEGRHDSPCLEREYGPATDDWLRSTLFQSASCVTIGFAIYPLGGEQSIEFRLAFNWNRQLAFKVTDYGAMQIMDGAGDAIWYSSTTLPINAWSYVEFAVLCAASGSYELRINGKQIAYKADTDTQYIGGQTINSVFIGWAGAGDTGCRIDDLYICHGDELKFFGDSRVDTLSLIANAEPQEWFPNPSSTPAEDVYTLLNQDEGTINSVSADAVSMFLPEALSSGATYIWGVQIVTRAGKTDAGDARISLQLRNGDTLIDGEEIGLSTSKLTYWQCYAQNPVTEANWTPVEVVNTDIGVKAIV